ncbi:MAG: hypothetical protein IJ272_09525 [Clostridia bacterium]|nr:hypothetical protein [Clostridia bacterium]
MDKCKKQIIYAVVVVIFAVFILVISPRVMQNDTFWSIKVGERIVREGIFGLDNFSIHEGLHYIAHHFLTDVLIYVVYSFSGFTGLYVMEVMMALIMAGLLYLLNKEISGNKLISAVMLFLQMCIMAMYISVRAQMISYILFILELLLLEKYKREKKKRYIIGLSIIPILLANFHMGTVPFYFVILGVYIISLLKIKIPFLEWTEQTDKERIKQLLLIGIIGLITIFINPYFIDGVIYPFKTFGNDFINTTIQEFQNLTISFDGGYSLIYIAIVIFVLILNKEKIKTGDFLLLFGTLFMAFTAIRYVGLFVVCSAVVLRYATEIGTKFSLKEEDLKAIKGTVGVLLALITATMLSGYMLKKDVQYVFEEKYPVKAVEFLKENMNKSDRIFNYYDWGSYLMLNDIRVYMDSRCDLYTKEYNGTDIADDYNKLIHCDKDYKEVIEKYNINMFIIPVDTALETLLQENMQFEKIYRDDVTVIYKQI